MQRNKDGQEYVFAIIKNETVIVMIIGFIFL
jgi:hypothetical protein